MEELPAEGRRRVQEIYLAMERLQFAALRFLNGLGTLEELEHAIAAWKASRQYFNNLNIGILIAPTGRLALVRFTLTGDLKKDLGQKNAADESMPDEEFLRQIGMRLDGPQDGTDAGPAPA